MPKSRLSVPSASLTSLRSPFAHGAIAAFCERQRFVWHHPRRIEVVHRAQPLALRARAVRRVERERARRHLRHADAAEGARQPPREQPIAAVQRVDDDDVVGEAERDLDRLGEPPLDAGLEISRSTTTSMVWLRRRSSLMSSSSERSWPSTRDLGEAARRAAPPAPS